MIERSEGELVDRIRSLAGRRRHYVRSPATNRTAESHAEPLRPAAVRGAGHFRGVPGMWPRGRMRGHVRGVAQRAYDTGEAPVGVSVEGYRACQQGATCPLAPAAIGVLPKASGCVANL